MWIRLQLEPNVQLHVSFVQRGDHRVSQIVIGRSERQPRNARAFLRLRPDRVLHGLSLAEQIRYAAEVRGFERTALCLDEQALHDEVEHMRAREVEKIENLR